MSRLTLFYPNQPRFKTREYDWVAHAHLSFIATGVDALQIKPFLRTPKLIAITTTVVAVTLSRHASKAWLKYDKL